MRRNRHKAIEPKILNRNTNSDNLAVLYQSLDELLMSDFIKCAIDKDYSVLVKSGEPTAEQINDAWIILISQWQVLMKSKNAKKHVNTASKIESLNTKIVIVTMLTAALEAGIDDKIVSELKAWGYDGKYTPETLAKDLDKVRRRLGNEKTQLAILQAGYNEDKDQKHEAPTRDSYMTMLIQINKHMQQHFRFEKITAAEFAAMYQDMVQYNELLIKQNKSNGR